MTDEVPTVPLRAGGPSGSLRGRLVRLLVAVVAGVALLIGVVTLSLVRLLPARGLEANLSAQAEAVTTADIGFRPCVGATAMRSVGTELFLVDAAGKTRRPACSDLRAVRRGPLAPVPEVDLAALVAGGQPASGVRGGVAYAFRPVPPPGGRRAAAVLLAQRSSGQSNELIGLVGRRLLLAGLLAVVAAAAAAWAVADRLTAPLGRLVAAARRIGTGELGTRVAVQGDDEVAEVADAFNDMAVALEHEQAEQRAFLASVGHELKTPLTTVQGYTEALLDGTVDTPEERRRSLERIHGETLRLARLVQDLLDLARLGRGQFAVALVDADVAAVLREAASAAADRAGARGVPVEQVFDQPLAAHVDPGRLRQVLDNLLDNATRSSPPGRPVTLAARARRDGRVEVAVVDQGPGIAPEDLPRAFERGYLWSRYRRTRTVGSGLGLAIVKALCDAMGVAIRAEQASGGGTAFRLLLPPRRGMATWSSGQVGLPAAHSGSPGIESGWRRPADH
jgi:two-component system, OmpR family, sensor kinase